MVPVNSLVKSTRHIFVGEKDGSFTYAPELVAGTIDARIPIVVADDFNGDGRADLAVFDYGGYVFSERQGYGNPPQLFLSNPDGRLRPSNALADAVRREHEQRPEHKAVVADVNGDRVIDFVVPYRDTGPGRLSGTADDFTMLVTLLNTTPAGPVRCRPRVTAVGTLPARTLYVGAGAIAEVVPVGGAFRNASTYRAASSASGVATVSVSGSQVTVTPAAAGVATITVTATGADNSVAMQRFRMTVTVLAATTFGDRLVPGTTPVRAIHFLELRTRIAALRARAGLPPMRWTDPVLTVGITPVKRAHLTELRAALDAAYEAAGRLRPTYTDHIVTAGMTALKAVHVVELRDAIRALE